MNNYKKPFMMMIVGLNCDTIFYNIRINNKWIGFKKSVGEFIHMMYILFPDVMKQADKYNFNDIYQLANWLYNYGEEIKPCDTYIFYNK